MTTSEYWDSLNFDYLTTYSLLRGKEWVTYCNKTKEQVKILKKQVVLVSDIEKNELLGKINILEGKCNPANTFLVDSNQNFHFSSKAITTIQRNSPETETLKDILQTHFTEQYYWMCAPVYRDVIIFYNANNEIVSVLNICLGCDSLQANYAVFIKLRAFLTQLGHEIEEI